MDLLLSVFRFISGRLTEFVSSQKGTADLAAFAIVLIFSLVVEYRRTRSVARFGAKSFRTDLVYSLVYLSGAYSLFVGLPIYRFLTKTLSHAVPFLQTHALVGLPAPLQFLIALVAADFTYYFWHRSVHATPILWAFHSIHHSQTQLTIATSLRVHIFEEMIRGLFYFVPFFILGLPTTVWLPLDIAINWLLFLEHSDLDFSYGPLGRILVSPHFHRIHHSVDPQDLNKNFGSFLAFWDPLFGTASDRKTRPEAYGLVQMSVPESFTRQFFFPFLWLRKHLASTAFVDQVPLSVSADPVPPGE
jgi:sterol desaturase/sphingolipid hydroxylase (fatty acid hydroxylase superfamily)